MRAHGLSSRTELWRKRDRNRYGNRTCLQTIEQHDTKQHKANAFPQYKNRIIEQSFAQSIGRQRLRGGKSVFLTAAGLTLHYRKEFSQYNVD